MKQRLSRSTFNWLFFITVSIVALVFVYNRGQDQNWDLLNYHYYTGHSLLNGDFTDDIAPVGLQSFLHPAVNMISYFLISSLSFPKSAWAITFLQLMSLPILLLISRRVFSSMGYVKIGIAELLSLVLCILSPLWWSELGTSFFSSTTTPIILLGFYFGLSKYSDDEKNKTTLFFAGLLLGFSTGLKLTNAVYCIGFVTALFVVVYNKGVNYSFRLIVITLFGMFFGFLITAWWYIYLLIEWSSPFFPLYNKIFQSPYFDPVNFRDTRWYFNSISDFTNFIFSAVTGTSRSLEILFSDARMVVFLLLLPVAIVANKFRKSISETNLFFLIFFFISFFLWAFMFAYQRYLIPIEILFGLTIWILVKQIIKNNTSVILILSGIVIFSAYFIKVPDWGHHQSVEQTNAFGLKLPSELKETPATYLVVGKPLGYLLPFLHQDSRHYGLGFSSKVDALILDTVKKDDNLPLRVLTFQSQENSIWQILEPFEMTPVTNKLSCFHINSYVGKYIVCEVLDKAD